MSRQDKPTVSVVIPTYNRPHYLKHCLRCLHIQASEAFPFEVVVVTDGPDAASADVAAMYANISYMPLRYLSLPEKKGPAAARNLGWRSACGELIIFTDDDCLCAGGFVAAYVKAYEEQQLQLAAFTGKLVVPLPGQPTDYEQNTAQLATAEFVTANCACTRATLHAVNGFDEEFTMAWREDSELQFKIIDRHIPVLRTETAVVIHPVRKAQWGVSIKEQKKSMFNALLKKKHPLLFREKIYRGPLINYYAMIIALLAGLVFLLVNLPLAALISMGIWFFLTLQFAYKRLQRTTRSATHVVEMLVTSALIPVLSVYWTLYGSWRFKSLLL